jgi:hypothetical protein
MRDGGNRGRFWPRSLYASPGDQRLSLSLDRLARHGRGHKGIRASRTLSKDRAFVLPFIVVAKAILGCGAVRELIFPGFVNLGS